MHHSPTNNAIPSSAGKQRWQEPAILVERPLSASAQDGGRPPGGPVFGPLSVSTVAPGGSR